jgi:hypothetical protein
LRVFPGPIPKLGSVGLFSVAILMLFPLPGRGQEFRDLVSFCAAGAGGLTGRCHVAALALDAARGGLATAASWGSQLPGSASTLGFRLRKSPRSALSARVGLVRFSIPGIRDGYDLPFGNEDVLVPALHLSGTVGVFDGFSPMPTMGGFLALDLTGSTHLLFPSEEDGFQDGLVGWGIGARLGLLRESFTLPGVSLSVTRRWMGTATLGDMDQGDAAEASFDVGMTSLRGIVGKDIFGLGFFAGAGLDRMSGGGTIRIRVSPTGFESEAKAPELPSDRMVFFAGASMTFLIIQLSGEVGWSEARDAPLAVDPGGTEFPSAQAYFGSVAFRITF